MLGSLFMVGVLVLALGQIGLGLLLLRLAAAGRRAQEDVIVARRALERLGNESAQTRNALDDLQRRVRRDEQVLTALRGGSGGVPPTFRETVRLP